MATTQQSVRRKLDEQSSSKIASQPEESKEAMVQGSSPFTDIGKTLSAVFAWVSGSQRRAERKAYADAYRAYAKTLPDNVIGSMDDVSKLAAKGIYLCLKNGARIDRL